MSGYTREGHRGRIRRLYTMVDSVALTDLNLLELYLASVIPRKDVKPIAFDLLEKFGGLQGVFDAPEEQLIEVKGIGPSTARAIKLFNVVKERLDNPVLGELLDTNDERAAYIRSNITVEKNSLYLVMMDNGNHAIKAVEAEAFLESATTRVEVMKAVLAYKATRCITVLCDIDDTHQLTGKDVARLLKSQDYLYNMNVCMLDGVKLTPSALSFMSEYNEYKRMLRLDN